MADPLFEDESPAIVEPTYDGSPADAEPKHPLIALVEKHFGEDSEMRAFFAELHEMMQREPGTDFWRGG